MKLFRWFVRGVPAGAAAAALVAVTLAPQQAQASSDTARLAQARLASVRQTLSDRATIPGTAWVTDPRVNRVVVTADPTVTGARLARLNQAVSRFGGAVEVRRSPFRLTRFIAGGDAIWGTSARCSLGFNVFRGGQPYFLTAGHCGNAVPSWSDTRGGRQVAVTEASSFPGHDFALARYTVPDVDHPSAVDLYNAATQPIHQARDARLGEAVQRSGSTTGVHGGTVTGLNATVNYPEGTVTGLIKTDVCAEPGDSGGPLFAGDAALGITSGGSGNCMLGGETYYQPVPQALQAYGASIG